MRVSRFIRELHARLLDAWGPQGWWPGGGGENVILGAVLTQNTNWLNVERALANLEAEGLRSVEAVASLGRRHLARLLKPAGYFNVKAERLQSVARHFRDRWRCDWEAVRAAPAAELRQELLAVHGIGPETADSILLYGFDHLAFVVDAYTKRMLRRHGLVGDRAGYDEIQALFVRHLPRDLTVYKECHALIVRAGSQLCRSQPRCGLCPLGVRSLFETEAFAKLEVDNRFPMADTLTRRPVPPKTSAAR